MRYLVLLLSLLLLSCQADREDQRISSSSPLPGSIPDISETDSIETKADWAIRWKLDSLYLIDHLESLLNQASEKMQVGDFDTLFTDLSREGEPNLEVNMKWGSLFGPDQQHLLIKRELGSLAWFDIFIHTGGKFVPVLDFETPYPFYTGDTIRDVNGDGRKDFIAAVYSSSGCCLRDGHFVFTASGDRGAFRSEPFFFLNPTYFPKEKLVRGITYGRPGEAGVYKIRWKKERLDTLEVIFPYEAEKQNYIRTPASMNYAEGEVISSLPLAYRQIRDFDWFDVYSLK